MFSTVVPKKIRRSVAARLSLWFAGLFAVGFTAIFSLLYWTLGRELEARDYDALQLHLHQYVEIYTISGLHGLRARLSDDSEAPHVRSLFIRIIGPGGSAIWGKIPPDWIDEDTQRVNVPEGWGGLPVERVYTLRVPRDQQQDLTVVSQVLPDGLLLQIGRSTDSRTVLLAPLRRTFLWVGGAVVLVGFGVGYFAAKQATRPLRQVVETARRIILTGALDARVPMPARDDDMAELVRYFNTVLEKNSGLIRSMREALDNVAHDLRTPLTSLRGTAELALQPGVDPAVSREALSDCIEGVDDVLRLLRALMEISEAEVGMLKLQQAPCDLADLAQSAVELYDYVAEAAQVALAFETAGPLPIYGDAIRLRQAIANLIDNGVKYTSPGGKVVVKGFTDKQEAVLQVVDTGPGIPESDHLRIWERLYRGDQSRSKSGLGLGLSLVKVILSAHGGSATVRNAAEGGAVFEIRLPLVAPGLPVV